MTKSIEETTIRKNKDIIVVFLGIVTFTTLLNAQINMVCSTPDPPQGPPGPTITIGGIYKPSIGILKVLVVFIRFNGDNETDSRWPDANVMPDWAVNFVDPTYSATGNYTQGCMSHFFYENSYGAYHVIGDVYYVTTVHDEDYYHNLLDPFGQRNPDYTRTVLSDEILNTLNGPPHNVDYSQYDNWYAVGNYTFIPDSSDGLLDMCWLITRNLHEHENDPGGVNNGKEFGTIWAQLQTSDPTYDNTTIKSGLGVLPFPGPFPV